MKLPQTLGLAAVVLFTISYFLPAYGDATGYTCFAVCWDALWKPAGANLGSWLYYSGFVVTNVLFVVLAISLFVTEKKRLLRLCVSLLVTLDVMSWSIAALLDSNRSAIHDIKVGYYLWFAAYAILFTAHTVKVRHKFPEPTARPAAAQV